MKLFTAQDTKRNLKKIEKQNSSLMSHSTVVLVKNMYIHYKLARCCFAEIEQQQAETETYFRDIYSKIADIIKAKRAFC